MQIIIIDDETHSAEFLEKMIAENIGDCSVVGKARTVKEASKLYNSLKPDLLIMDINLGDHLSFDLFDYIDPAQLNVIFTTSYWEFAVQAFKVNAVDYLIKPINVEELKASIVKARERSRIKELDAGSLIVNRERETAGILLVWENNRLIPVKMEEIIKIKSDGTYSKMHMINDRKVHTCKNLGVYEALLKENGFIRIHNSCIMNPRHLVDYRPGIRAFVTLSDQKVESVSKNRKKELLRIMRLPML
jgi:two-component system LytT family response regulator